MCCTTAEGMRRILNDRRSFSKPLGGTFEDLRNLVGILPSVVNPVSRDVEKGTVSESGAIYGQMLS